jgi:hypothetical protein
MAKTYKIKVNGTTAATCEYYIYDEYNTTVSSSHYDYPEYPQYKIELYKELKSEKTRLIR